MLRVVEKGNELSIIDGRKNRFVDVPRKYLIASPRFELELSGFMRTGIEIDDRLFRKTRSINGFVNLVRL